MAVSKKKTLNDIKAEINKLHGDNALVKLNDVELDIPKIPTGILSVDHVLRGGLPRGKMTMAYGKEAGGKSAIATQFAGQAQKFGEVVYVDLENSFDPNKALNSGVNLDELFLSQPRSAEETLEVIEHCLQADDVSAIIVDSVAAMATNSQIAGDYSDQHVAGLARVLSLGLTKINQVIIENNKDTIIFFINQIRDTIGGYGYGPTTTTPGGRALKFYTSLWLEVARTGNLKQGEEIIGQTSQVTLKKSRYAPPFQKASFDIYYETGISNESSVIDLAVTVGRLEKSGGWYTDTVSGEKLGNGKSNVIAYLQEKPDIFQEIYQYVLENT